MRAVGVASKKLRRENCVHSIIEFVNKLLSYAEGAPSPILEALSDRRGNRFQKFSARIFLHAMIQLPRFQKNKLHSYVKGAPIPFLKALNERRGNRVQHFRRGEFFRSILEFLN